MFHSHHSSSTAHNGLFIIFGKVASKVEVTTNSKKKTEPAMCPNIIIRLFEEMRRPGLDFRYLSGIQGELPLLLFVSPGVAIDIFPIIITVEASFSFQLIISIVRLPNTKSIKLHFHAGFLC